MTKEEPSSATFKLDKETRNTARYAEEAERQRPVVGLLYAQKDEVPGPHPKQVRGTIIGVLCAFVLSLFAGYEAHSQEHPRRTWKPFVAEKRVLNAPTTQATPLIHHETFARRSDGSYVRSYEVKSPTGEKEWMVEIHDLRNGRSITLEPSTKFAMTFYYSDKFMREWIETQHSCDRWSFPKGALTLQPRGRRDMILGHEVVQAVVEDPDGDRTETWVAPELDCHPLREALSSDDGYYQEHVVTRLEEIEPPDSIFEVPRGYVEASPKQVEAAYAAKYPGHRLWGEKMAAIVDKRYFNSRDPKKRKRKTRQLTIE